MEEKIRFKDKEKPPAKAEIDAALDGKAFAVWSELSKYLDEAYQIVPDLVFGGKNYGWCYKYRKGGRTLCCLFPERGSFTVLIIMGGKDLEKLKPEWGTLSAPLQDLIEKTHQYHDGKWLWINLPDGASTTEIKTLLKIKRKPKL